jgi:hypothetical protein
MQGFVPGHSEAAADGTASGVVEGVDGPLAHAYVHAWKNVPARHCGVTFGGGSCAQPAGKGVYTADDGSFSLSLPSGQYAFSISPDPSSGLYFGRWFGGDFFESDRDNPRLLPEPGTAALGDPAKGRFGGKIYRVSGGSHVKLGNQALSFGGLVQGKVRPYKAHYHVINSSVAEFAIADRTPEDRVPNTDGYGLVGSDGNYQTEVVLPPGLAQILVQADSSKTKKRIQGSAVVTISANKITSASFLRPPATPRSPLRISGGYRVGQQVRVNATRWTRPTHVFYDWAGESYPYRRHYVFDTEDYGARPYVDIEAESPGRWDHSTTLKVGRKVAGPLVRFTEMETSPILHGTKGNAARNREWVEIKNFGKRTVNLKDWRVVHGYTGKGPTFTFRRALHLRPGGHVRVRTGKGRDTRHNVYWGLSEFIWQSSDEASLFQSNGVANDDCYAAPGKTDCSGSAPGDAS